MRCGLSLIGMHLPLPSCLKVVTDYSEIRAADITAWFGRLRTTQRIPASTLLWIPASQLPRTVKAHSVVVAGRVAKG